MNTITLFRARGSWIARFEWARAADSNYFGVEGERAMFVLTMVDKKIIEGGTYGDINLISFIDAAGNRAKWFGSIDASYDLVIGTTYTVKATVKAHEEYKGCKQTMLSRVSTMTAEMVAEELAKAERAAARAAKKAAKLLAVAA